MAVNVIVVVDPQVTLTNVVGAILTATLVMCNEPAPVVVATGVGEDDDELLPEDTFS